MTTFDLLRCFRLNFQNTKCWKSIVSYSPHSPHVSDIKIRVAGAVGDFEKRFLVAELNAQVESFRWEIVNVCHTNGVNI